MFGTILSLFIGALPAIVREIATARNNLENAKTDQERIAAEERIKALEAQRDVLIREADTPWNHIARFTILAPIAFYLAWISAWDKIACKWFFEPTTCTTDPLSVEQWWVAGTVIGFYFLTDATKFWKR